MTGYEKMAAAADAARARYFERQNQAWRALTKTVYSLAEYAGMPDDPKDGYWNLGVCITLSPPNHFPARWASFALCASEKDGETLIKIGHLGKSQTIRLDDPSSMQAFYDTLIAEIVEQFDGSPSVGSAKKTGFNMSPMER